MKQEIEKIPELLEDLTPIDRLNMVCKIMRKKASNECDKFHRLVFSDKTVDKEGFVSFNLNL